MLTEARWRKREDLFIDWVDLGVVLEGQMLKNIKYMLTGDVVDRA